MRSRVATSTDVGSVVTVRMYCPKFGDGRDTGFSASWGCKALIWDAAERANGHEQGKVGISSKDYYGAGR